MKIFKKALCIFLIVVMCLTSAPLQGLVGTESNTLSLSAGAADAIFNLTKVLVEGTTYKISWQDISNNNLLGYKVYRINKDGSDKHLGSRATSSTNEYIFYDNTSYNDGYGLEYSYRIEAWYKDGSYNSYYTDAGSISYKVGDIIQFGSYPQSKVTDSATITALNSKAPAWDNWTSYGYYTGNGNYGSMVQGDWMRYTDVTYNGNKYRGVKFTQYRPYYTLYNSSSSNTYQDDNGYNTNTVYWFKFESIDWRVLDSSTGLVMCETIIDSQPCSNTIYSSGGGTYGYFNDASYANYASDYETSTIRKWLNNDFYNTAFTDSEKKEISTTTLNNDGYYTSVGTTGYEKLDSNETKDKIFLLSYNEVRNSNFGFSSDQYEYDTARFGKGSDYAQSQGLYVYRSSGSTYNGNSFWLLRSSGFDSFYCCNVSYYGFSNEGYFVVRNADIGVRPALRFNRISGISQSVSVKYKEGENPKYPTFFITPKALDGGWGKDNIVSNGTAVTNNGTATFTDKFQIERSKIISTSGSAKGTVTIKADGYRNYIIPNEVLKNVSANSDYNNYYGLNAYMQLKKDSKPYISSVFAKHSNDTEYTDITANELNCDTDNLQDIIVSVDGLEMNEFVSKIYIAQSSKESFSENDGVFTSVKLASKFEENKQVYVYAETSKGRKTAVQNVNINIVDNEQIGDGLDNILTMDLFGNGGQSIGLTGVDIPFLKDAKISFDAFKFPIGISKDGDKWKVSLGVDIFTYENEIGDDKKGKWKSFKEQVDDQITWLGDPDKDDAKSFKDAIGEFQKIWKKFGDKKKVEKYIKANKKAALDFNVGFLGYIEGEYNDGKWTTTDCEGVVLINFKIEKSTPISILGFPCYWGIGGGADASAGIEGTRQVADKNLPMEITLALSIEPFISGKFGAGVDKLLYAGITGKGSAPTQFKTADKYLKIDFSAKFGWEAGIWILTADGTIWKGSTTVIEKYFDAPKRVVRSFAMDYATKPTSDNTEQKAQVLSRDYAETTSEWLYGEPQISTFALRDYVQQGVTFTDLQQSVFADSKLQMVQVGNDTFATWIEDDTSRDTYNRMRLVYSVRNGDTGLWSEPKAVWDTGVNDGYPSIATDGEKVYVTWQKVNKIIKESDCVDATVFYNNGEICLAEYDINNDKVTSTKFVTDNNYYDYSPIVIVNNNEPVVFWTSSEDNNMTAMNGCNFNRYSNGTTTTLLEGISSPITVSAEVFDGKENISYSTDTDSNFETTDDITVNTYIDGNITTFDKGEISLAIKDAKYGKLNGESVLFMQDGTNIFYEEDGEIVNVFDVDRNIDGNFSIVEAVNGTQLIWTEKDENGSSNIFSCVYSDNVWSDPVKVSGNDKYITNLVAVCANGKIIGGCNRTEVFYDEETQEVTRGFTDLSCWSMEDFSDISIELFSYREKDFIESGSKSFDLHISNNGTTNIDEIEFVIEDTLGNNTTVTKEVNLISGEAQTVEVPYTPAENYTATTLTVTANIPNDVDEEDNVASFEVGSSDVAIEVGDVIEQEDCFDISTLISNISLIDAENVKLSIYANSEDSEAIETFDIGNMTASSIGDAHVSIKKEAVTFSESGTGVVYLKLTAEDESNTNNNDVCVALVLEKEKECGHPLTETVVGKAPTCTEDGTSDYEVCLVCGENATESEVVSAKHSFVDWYIVIPANCEVAGEKKRDCSECDYSETDTIAALEHSYESVVTPATCTSNGYTTNTCSVCGNGYTSDITEKLAHSMSEWYIVTSADCTTNGTEQRDCSECDYSETQKITATGHDFDGSKCKNCDYDKADDCNCKCHKGGIAGFFFKIILFFQKIFKTNQICEGCGIKHY